MTEHDRSLAVTLTRAMPDDAGEPSFSVIWDAAERRVKRSRRRLHLSAAAAVALLALLFVADISEPPEQAFEYIEPAELLNSTSWSAPSDVLLSTGRVDLYQDVPNLLESTDVYRGALL